MPGQRLSFDVIQLIYYNHQLGKSVADMVEMFSVSRKTIYNVLSRTKNEVRLELISGGAGKLRLANEQTA